jgi:hypothetical protein
MTSKTVIIDLSHCDSPVAAVEAKPEAVEPKPEAVEPKPVVVKQEPGVEGGKVSYPSYMGGSPRWPGSPRAYTYSCPSPSYAPSSPSYTPQVIRAEGPGPLPPLALEQSAKPRSPMPMRTLRMLADSDEAKRRREMALIDAEIKKLEEKKRRLGP